MNQPRDYVGDFEPPPPSQGMWIFCVVVMLVAGGLCGFWAGVEFSNNLHKQQLQKLTPKAAPTRHDPLSFYCKDQASRNEFHRVCTARRRAI